MQTIVRYSINLAVHFITFDIDRNPKCVSYNAIVA
jgi:hypothetical protein